MNLLGKELRILGTYAISDKVSVWLQEKFWKRYEVIPEIRNFREVSIAGDFNSITGKKSITSLWVDLEKKQ